MKSLKKRLAIAVTVALLALPLSSTLTMADTAIPVAPTPTTTTVPATPTALQEAEAAVAAYEAGQIITLAEVTITEDLKVAADTSVATVGGVTAKTALELRITNRAAVIATAKTTIQAAVAESAVVAYEAAPISTLAQVATAEGLKAVAVTAVTAVGDTVSKTALELRVTNRTQTIATAKATLVAQVVDANGNTVTSSNWFKDLIVKLQLALTLDPARKGELNERQALAKLAEARELMNDGKTEAAEICYNQYSDKIANAQAFLDSVKDPNSETAKTLAKALNNVNSNNIQVLGSLLDKLPPQAAQKLALNVVRSMEKAIAKYQSEDAKVDLETTPVTKPVVDNKILGKQATVALENFKKSLDVKKIHIEDQGQQANEGKNVVDQSKPAQEKPEIVQDSQQVTQSQSPQAKANTPSQPAHVTTAPVKTQVAPTIHDNNDGNKHEDNKKNNGGSDHRSN